MTPGSFELIATTPMPRFWAALPIAAIRLSHSFAHGHALHVNTTSVPFLPARSATAISLPSMFLSLASAIGIALPSASGFGAAASSAKAVNAVIGASASASRSGVHRVRCFMSISFRLDGTAGFSGDQEGRGDCSSAARSSDSNFG